MPCVPAARPDVEHRAVRLLPAPLSGTAAQRASEAPPLLKLTVPVGAVPLTVATNVTRAPTVDGLTLLARVVALGSGALPTADATAAPALTMPAPHSAVVQLHSLACGIELHAVPVVGNTRAVVESFDSTCAGVSDAFAESMSDTTPVTCGAAMLVPAYCP